jgi:hypothetical protein
MKILELGHTDGKQGTDVFVFATLRCKRAGNDTKLPLQVSELFVLNKIKLKITRDAEGHMKTQMKLQPFKPQW